VAALPCILIVIGEKVMDTSTIREAVLRQPFQPFHLRMNDGREFYVPHPEYIAVSKRVVMVIDPTTEAGIQLEPLLIASMHFESTPSSPASGSNGA
jgi:hypothetical protein